MKCSIQEELNKRFFLCFQIYCSCFNYIIHVLSFSKQSLENVYKSSEHVSFCYCTEINISREKMYPQNMLMRPIRSSGVGNCLILQYVPGFRVRGIDHRKKERNRKSQGYAGGSW